MKKIFIIFLIPILFFSCKDKKPHFTVEGFIINGNGEKVYLEHNGLTNTITLDSASLNTTGQFEFKAERPAYPDFYSLRINNKRIIFAVDSIEKIIVSGDNSRFTTNYNITNSPHSESIKILRKSVIDIQNKISRLSGYKNQEEYDAFLSEIKNDIQGHRQLAREVILKEPRTSAAYFALFQKVNDSYIFNPYDEDDLPYWRAVATAYNAYMPEYERSKNLNVIVLSAIKQIQEEKEEVKRQIAMNDIMNKAVGYIDILLPDREGKERKLSELEGKVVLINFIAYEQRGGVDYTFSLRNLYDKYHEKGFEIYQVSLDRNKLFWDVSTEALPWVCVHDLEGNNAYYASVYNVRNVPASFLMDKEGNIIARDLSWDKLDKEVERLTKEKR